MPFIIGMIIVFGCVLGSYAAHGDLRVLWQPLELVIILGSAMGAFVISNPGNIMKASVKSLSYLFKRQPYKKKDYLNLLQFSFEIYKLVKTKGILQIESHIENPKDSNIFQKYPTLLNDLHFRDFFCDNIRLITLGVDNQYVMSDAIDQELEVHHNESHAVAHALTIFGESLPALGIVAAVLGVIVTMGSIDEPPEILGGLIGAALVGTFVGILFSYGVFSPIAGFVKNYLEEESCFYNCIKVGIISHLQGNAPAITVEMMRKNIPSTVRPSFAELDTAVNS